MGVSYLHPHVDAVPTRDEHGEAGLLAIARAPIASGTVVAAFGGSCITRAELDALPVGAWRRSLQIDDDLFIAGADEPEPADAVRHSCVPNCGMRGGVMVVAMRDIEAGARLSYDYAMTDGSEDDTFACSCGADRCRGVITGQDWTLPEVQLAYRGFFSPYLARRISGLVSVGAERRAFAL